ncbi:MAG: hydroxymethylbilane synthase [Pseudomonadales bacterium]|nr:hydroxymethylbilane synthase [Pseudomonadales bacterium]NIX06704.1 hydroxymethylbilane synthase [Pseudomonadales bacterium]
MSALRLVIATRQSQLALWQANFVSARLREAHPDLTVELHGMTTRGDKWLSSPLAKVGGKGLFIKELEEALASGAADVAVHSVKDVPAELPQGFAMPVIAYREDPRDVLVTREGVTLAGLPAGARIGSSSLRRQAQLLAERPDLVVEPIRGNVDTRLRKLDDGEYDAVVLAAAGLARLGLSDRASEYLATEVCLPAAGQGALGIECRAGDDRVLSLLEPLEDAEVAACVAAERTVSAVLRADCTAPLAAHARPAGEGVVLQSRLASSDGRRILEARGEGTDPLAVGESVAASLIAQGAAEVLGGGG